MMLNLIQELLIIINHLHNTNSPCHLSMSYCRMHLFVCGTIVVYDSLVNVAKQLLHRCR